MNLVLEKYRSKYYCDRKLNLKNVRLVKLVYVSKEFHKSKHDRDYEDPYKIISIDYKNKNVK